MLWEKQCDTVKTQPKTASLGVTITCSPSLTACRDRETLEQQERLQIPDKLKTILIKQTHCCPLKGNTLHDPLFQEIFVSLTFFKLQILSLEQNVSHSYTLAV